MHRCLNRKTRSLYLIDPPFSLHSPPSYPFLSHTSMKPIRHRSFVAAEGHDEIAFPHIFPINYPSFAMLTLPWALKYPGRIIFNRTSNHSQKIHLSPLPLFFELYFAWRQIIVRSCELFQSLTPPLLSNGNTSRRIFHAFRSLTRLSTPPPSHVSLIGSPVFCFIPNSPRVASVAGPLPKGTSFRECVLTSPRWAFF